MKDETYMVIGGRQSGKTTALIRKSAETGYSIVVNNKTTADFIKRDAAKMELAIPEPIVANAQSINSESTRNEIEEAKGILVDDFNIFIDSIFHGKYAGCSVDNFWVKDIENIGGMPDKTATDTLDYMAKKR